MAAWRTDSGACVYWSEPIDLPDEYEADCSQSKAPSGRDHVALSVPAAQM